MPTTRLSNLGYLAIGKQSDKDVAVTPSIYVPLYSESLMSAINLDADNPIIGNKADIFQHIQGQRHHVGDVQILAEPTTIGYFFDMLLNRSATSGAGDPYTHTFSLNSTNPNAYTVDIAKGQVVFRFIGVEASQIGHEFDANKMLLNLALSARKSFIVREVDSIDTATITFKTNYDPSPTTGLVASDLITVRKADGTELSHTVSTVDDATDITLNSTPSGVAQGDLVYLRPATPSFSLVTPFLWSRTEFRFGATAAAALSATHTPVEQGSNWQLMHNFANNEGEKRSGSFDPAELARVQGGGQLDAKIRFDTPEDMNNYLTLVKRACVIRHFSGDNHELRITFNNLKFNEEPVTINTGELIYAEGMLKPEYDDSDGQNMDVKVLTPTASI